MLQGGCLCGAVRYEVDGAPFDEAICHCVDCRRAVGATAVAWFTVPRSSFRLLAGVPTSFRSSPQARREFCGTCGTALTWVGDALPNELDVTIASLDDPGSVAPKVHLFAASRPSWAALGDGLPSYPERRPKRSTV